MKVLKSLNFNCSGKRDKRMESLESCMGIFE